MDLPDALAIAGGASVVVGGFAGLVVGAGTFRQQIDDGQRGAFFGLWLGSIIGFLAYLASQTN